MLLGNSENVVLEICAKWIVGHFHFCCPAPFAFRLKQSVHNPVSCAFGVIADIRRIDALVLDIVAGANMADTRDGAVAGAVAA